jgi:DNA invertase Pin-like site-specific DNA recombinase
MSIAPKLNFSLQERLQRIRENPPIPKDNNGVNYVNTTYGYTRVSTMAQVIDGVSLATQEIMIRERAKLLKLNDPQIYPEEGKTGRKKDREKYNFILNSLKPGDTLMCYSQSRLSRKLIHFLEFLEKMEKKKIRLICLKDSIDLDFMNCDIGASMRMCTQMIGTMSEAESNQTSSRVKDGMKKKSADGTLHKRAHFGTKYISDPNKPGKKIQVVDEDQQKVIDFIYSMLIDAKDSGTKIIVSEIVRGVNFQIEAGNLNFKNRVEVQHNQISRIIDRQGFRPLLDEINGVSV